MGDIKNRETRVKIAKETLEIISSGSYINSDGENIILKDKLEYSISESVLYKPDMFEAIARRIEEQKTSGNNDCKIEVTGETAINASFRLTNVEGIKDTMCLNFASAKNPGGGFLTGSQAQEESLARSSGLYPCISQMKEMYDYNRSRKTCLYSDYMIYSPEVPFIRNDSGKLLKQPFYVSIITAPAVNAGVVRERKEESMDRIHEVMLERISKILFVAALHNNKALVLGAYGCGVFKNRPEDVAEYFRKVLLEESFAVLFDKIVFAIYESSIEKSKLKIFKEAFGV